MIVPYKNRLLVKLVHAAAKTDSGVYIPGIQEDATARGLVLEVGSEVKGIEKENTVMFAKDTGFRFQDGTEWMIIFEADDVLAVIR